MSFIFGSIYLLVSLKFLLAALFFDWLANPALSLLLILFYIGSVWFSKLIASYKDYTTAEAEWKETEAAKFCEYKTLILVFTLLGPVNLLAVPLSLLLNWAASTQKTPEA